MLPHATPSLTRMEKFQDQTRYDALGKSLRLDEDQIFKASVQEAIANVAVQTQCVSMASC